MMKCTCAECGITKTKFIKSQSTGGAIAGWPTKPYCGINKVPKGKHRGTELECIRQNQIRQYGINKAYKNLMKNIKMDPETASLIKNIKMDPNTAKSLKKAKIMLLEIEELKKQEGN